MRDRRAQLAIFIIVAIVIMISFAIIFFSTQKIVGEKRVPEENLVSQSINSYVTSCLDATAKNAIWLLGRYGGYIYPTTGVNELNLEFVGSVTFLYYADKYVPDNNDLPEISYMEEEISYYVSNELKNCINFKTFEEQGFTITTGVPEVKTTIRDESVLVELDYPITAKKGDTIVKMQKFRDIVNIRVGLVYKTVQTILERVREADVEGDPTIIATVSKDIEKNPRFSINYLFGFKPILKVNSYTFVDEKDAVWMVYDERAVPEYLFIFATKHRRVI